MHGGKQLFLAVRFDQANRHVETAEFVHSLVIAAPSGRDDGDLRLYLPERPDQCDSVHKWHHEIGKHGFYLTELAGKNGDRFRALSRHSHPIAVPLENRLGHFADGLLIIHNKQKLPIAIRGKFLGIVLPASPAAGRNTLNVVPAPTSL